MELKKLRMSRFFIPAILKEKKTTTIRLKTDLQPGELVEIVDDRGSRVCYAYVEDVVEKRLEDLTDEDAVRDGFSSKEQLLSFLGRVYEEKLRSSEKVFVIRFKIIKGKVKI